MKVEHIHPCEGPRCKSAAIYIIRLENGKALLQVCESHEGWGKREGKRVENS